MADVRLNPNSGTPIQTNGTETSTAGPHIRAAPDHQGPLGMSGAAIPTNAFLDAHQSNDSVQHRVRHQTTSTVSEVSMHLDPASLRAATQKVVDALVRDSEVDRFLLESGHPNDKADIHRLAETIARTGDCVVLRCHPQTYGSINHISAMVIKRLDDGQYKIGVAHHESINLAEKPGIRDGAMTSATGLRWKSYDTGSLFESVGQPMPFENLPVLRSAVANGFPSSNVIPCSDPDAALRFIESETLRSERMLKSRDLIRQVAPPSTHELLDGLPPYGYARATQSTSGDAFYTPALPSDSIDARVAAMQDVAARQVNSCFEYVAGVLMCAQAKGAERAKLGTDGGELLMGLAPLLGGVSEKQIRGELSRKGLSAGAFEAFRMFGKSWGFMPSAMRQWDVSSTRPPVSRL
jgi:hypothetical protein